MSLKKISLWFCLTITTYSSGLTEQEALGKAAAYTKEGNHSQAAICYQQANILNPDNFETLFYYANELFKANQLDDAIFTYREAIACNPTNAFIYFNLGLALAHSEKWEESIAAYKKAVHLNPLYAKARLYAANLLCKTNKAYRALIEYKQLLQNHNGTYEIYCNMGKMYHHLQLHEKAVESFSKAITLKPDDASLWTEPGNCLLQLGIQSFNAHDPLRALEIFEKIATLSDGFAVVHHNIGFTLTKQLGRYQEAIQAFNKALTINPKAAETHFCLAVALLASGDFIKGFNEYRWRWQRTQHRPRSFPYPLPNQWDGTDITGKKILIRSEQGLGDTLQFVRYAQLLHDQGATIILELQKPLIPLLSLSPYIDQIVPMGAHPPDFDVQIPMLDLPYLFKTTPETVPQTIPYIYPSPTLVQAWKNNLPDDGTFKIGICWHGDSANGANKFMPLDHFARIAELDDVQLFSLQKIDGLEQLQPYAQTGIIKTFDTETFDTMHGAFMDTAAIMQHLDLVITVDTSLAHLAGALGVPTWVVLPFPAEWRWLTERSDSPWYPTIKLFRQGPDNKWEPVIEEIIDSLIDVIADRKIL